MESGNPSRLAVAAWAVGVFVLAVLLRAPSCYESFWLDELHTAWAIWGDFSQVSPRAEVGNQTQLYFQLMWLWKQVFGESEVALRLSSVLASALASALLVVGVTRATSRLSAGVLAGAILAIETNAIFFGTEFRPYAWVMLCSAIAVWSGVALVSRQSDRSCLTRIVFVSSICVAGLLHPTALVALGILATAFAFVAAITWFRTPDRRIQFALGDLIWIALLMATVFALLNSSLPDSWERRDNWRAFGVARSTSQLWTIWSWTALAIFPVALGTVTAWRRTSREVLLALLPLVVAVLATAVFFIASHQDFVPLWHRRYFVAVLPMLAWSAGALPMLGLPDRATWWSRTIASVFVLVVLFFVARQDFGIAGKLTAGKTTMVTRGEDWRGAIGFVKRHRTIPNDAELWAGINSVWLDTDLIEAQVFEQRPDDDVALAGLHRDYFRFPVMGPYRLSKVQATTPRADSLWFDGVPYVAFDRDFGDNDYIENILPLRSDTDALWIISRGRSKATIDRWCNSLWITQFNKPEFRHFGRILVVKIPEPKVQQLKNWLESARKTEAGL